MVTEDSHQTDVDATHLERVDESGIKTVLNVSLEKHWKCPNAVDEEPCALLVIVQMSMWRE